MSWMFLVAFLALELMAAKGLLRPHVPKVTPDGRGMLEMQWRVSMAGTKDSQEELGSTFPPSIVREISRKISLSFPNRLLSFRHVPCHSL